MRVLRAASAKRCSRESDWNFGSTLSFSSTLTAKSQRVRVSAASPAIQIGVRANCIHYRVASFTCSTGADCTRARFFVFSKRMALPINGSISSSCCISSAERDSTCSSVIDSGQCLSLRGIYLPSDFCPRIPLLLRAVSSPLSAQLLPAVLRSPELHREWCVYRLCSKPALSFHQQLRCQHLFPPALQCLRRTPRFLLRQF